MIGKEFPAQFSDSRVWDHSKRILSSQVLKAGLHCCRAKLKSNLENFYLISTSFIAYPVKPQSWSSGVKQGEISLAPVSAGLSTGSMLSSHGQGVLTQPLPSDHLQCSSKDEINLLSFVCIYYLAFSVAYFYSGFINRIKKLFERMRERGKEKEEESS